MGHAMTHTGRLVEVGHPTAGHIEVFYAHGSDSVRTALGKSKFHTHAGCRALLAGNAAKAVIREWHADVPERGWCRVCRKRDGAVAATGENGRQAGASGA